MNVLALQVGTASVKASVLQVENRELAGPISEIVYALNSPYPEAFEVPADRLWRAVAAASRSAVQQAGVAGRPGHDVAAVGLSCFASGLVLLDKADKPLRPIWTPDDRRARPIARQVWGAVGEEFLQDVGSRPLPGVITALSFRQMLIAEPYLLHDVRSYLHLNGWLALHMTGHKTCDAANASCTGLFGTLTERRWSDRWCAYFEVDEDWLPQVVLGSASVGSLRAAVAAELGVPAGIPVKLGSDAISMAMLATDIEPGDLLHILGPTEILAVRSLEPTPSPRRMTRMLGVGDGFVQLTQNHVGLGALDWLRQLCFHEQTDEEFEDSVKSARDRKTRVSLDPPNLGGDLLEIDARRAAFRDLELTTNRLDLLAALAQAIARSYRDACSALGHGAPFRRICLTGAGDERLYKLLGYQTANVQQLPEAALSGVAKLFTM